MIFRNENNEIGALYESVKKEGQILLNEHDSSYPDEFRKQSVFKWIENLKNNTDETIKKLGHEYDTLFGKEQKQLHDESTIGEMLRFFKVINRDLYDKIESDIDRYNLTGVSDPNKNSFPQGNEKENWMKDRAERLKQWLETQR